MGWTRFVCGGLLWVVWLLASGCVGDDGVAGEGVGSDLALAEDSAPPGAAMGTPPPQDIGLATSEGGDPDGAGDGNGGSGCESGDEDAGPACGEDPQGMPPSSARPGEGSCIEEPPGGEQPSLEAGRCRFEYLGDWVRCENAGWPNSEILEGATSLQDCLAACAQRADCVAVTDWYWLDLPDLTCALYASTCDAPCVKVWSEEDGGKQYRKVCAH